MTAPVDVARLRRPTCEALTYPLGGTLIPCGLPLNHQGAHCGEFGYCAKYLNGHVLLLDTNDHRRRDCACGASTFENVPVGHAACCVEAEAMS